MAVADSHCHLDIMGGDVRAQLDLAASVGIDLVVQVGVDLSSSALSAERCVDGPAVKNATRSATSIEACLAMRGPVESTSRSVFAKI